ncbi:MAG: hypothetical protein ACYCW6_00720 [Candidatus Xenobia bacterium]
MTRLRWYGLFLVLSLSLSPGMAWADPNLHQTVTALYEADQKDRAFFEHSAPGQWKLDDMIAVAKRDAGRRAQLRTLLAAGGDWDGTDYYHAAMVFQHGDDAADNLLLAHTLATLAAARGVKGALWLSAATLDRYLQKVGQSQVFGTQYRKADNTKPQSAWTMDPYQADLLPDFVRAAFDVPSKKDGIERLKRLQHNQPLVPHDQPLPPSSSGTPSN